MPAGDEESWDFPPAAASHPRVASSMSLTRVQPELFAQALSLSSVPHHAARTNLLPRDVVLGMLHTL